MIRRQRSEAQKARLLELLPEYPYALDLMAVTGWKSGTVYTRLAEMERAGIVVSEFEQGGFPRRRRYSVAAGSPGGSGG